MNTTRFHKYDVAPFSGANFSKNSAKCADADPCAICGRAIKTKKFFEAIVINGGADWGDESSPEDGGHMGVFPVGSDCHRRHVTK